MVLKAGSRAPDFTLEDNRLEPITLSSFLGYRSVLLVYCQHAFAPVCEDELCQIRDEIDLYHDYDVQVLGVSVDSPFCLNEWAKRRNYPFPLLSDFWPHGEVASAYGAFNGVAGVARRGTFLIDLAGIIRFAEVQETDQPRDQSAWKTMITSALEPKRPRRGLR